jgi:hypothetical protein
VNRQNGGIGALGMVISPDGTFTNARDIVDDVVLPLDEWLHVVGTFEPSQFMRLYVNGQLVHQVTSNIPSQIFSNTADLWIGRQFSASSDFHLDGLIDEAAVYNRALSASEILEHYLAATTLSGDFNSDGVVNAADYVVWRDKLNFLGNVPGDLTPGVVTAADYESWRDNFGASAFGEIQAGQTTVPEPFCGTLAIVALLSTLCKKVFPLRCWR